MESSTHGHRSPLAIAASYFREAPVDLLGMATDLGLSVDLEADMPRDLSGRISRGGTGPTGYLIEVNRLDPPDRKRFTLAHEIAHFLLHRDLIDEGIEDNGLYRSRLADRTEIEANRLAANIIMPAQLVRNVYNAGVKHLDNLSVTFQVSEEAMRVRLRQLGLAR
jgi:hypothetical protein